MGGHLLFRRDVFKRPSAQILMGDLEQAFNQFAKLLSGQSEGTGCGCHAR